MPTPTPYMFKHKINSNISITMEVYGDETVAVKRLSNYVINTNDWYL